MKAKKTKKADLNNFTTTFFLLGLVAMLFISWKAIELKTYKSEIEDEVLTLSDSNEEETIDITIEQPKIKEPEPIPVKPEKIEIVEDKKDIEESVFLPNSEDDDNTAVKDPIVIDVKDDEPEVVTEVAFKLIQNPPVFPGCEGKKGADALKDCMSKKIQSFVGDKFDKEIAEDLGISGRVRIMTQFTIDKTGKVTKILTRSKYKELENEARRVINKLPKVKPGQQRNKPVNVTYTLPIIFKVQD